MLLPYLTLGAPLSQLAGARHQLRPPNPAAGADLVLTVPGGEYWIVERGSLALTTSAAVANRTPRVAIADADGVIVWMVATANVLPASTAGRVSFESGGAVAGGQVNGQALSLPAAAIPPGYSLRTAIAAIDAADAITAVAIDILAITLGADGQAVGRPDEYLPMLAESEGA